ncbi:hypothetical protein [Mycetocola saprophilus]|uniref:hypothetical protein n=1 Tax=Mycetocola saprophilus TaxID=76636 RepID=UPI003BF2DD4E
MTVKRAPRGTRVAPVRAAWSIETYRKERFDQIARTSGYTSSVFLEMVIDHLESELTDRGVPNWVPQPEPKDGELLIDPT